MITFTPAQKKQRNKLVRKLQQRDPGRPYAACIREAVEIVQGGKRVPKKRAARAVGETARRTATERAVDRAIQKALSGKAAKAPAAGPAGPAGPGTRLLAEMSAEELSGQVAEVYGAAAGAPAAASGEARPVAESALEGLQDRPLHELDQETWEQHFGSVVVAQAEAALASPFARGPGAGQSPFWRGLNDS